MTNGQWLYFYDGARKSHENVAKHFDAMAFSSKAELKIREKNSKRN